MAASSRMQFVSHTSLNGARNVMIEIGLFWVEEIYSHLHFNGVDQLANIAEDRFVVR